ncbi:MAG: hypothetical protein HQL42_11355 [Alphaproteobacteria bacterium]|nr:hypothetical protein [Alphaproteobacteria bacterium]
MGLYIHSLSRLPIGVESDYYLYLLDYGWHEPLGEALHANFRRMADLAAKNKAVVLAGTDSRAFADEMLAVHFDDPQFSWSNINGESGEEILPALMISTLHPQRFREQNPRYQPRISSQGMADDKLILIPLREACKNTTEVVALIERIFRDVAAQKPLSDFAVAKEIKAGNGRAISDALILKPALWGMGVDLKELVRNFRARRI